MAEIYIVGIFKLTLSFVLFSLSICELSYAQQYNSTSNDGYYRVEVNTRTIDQIEKSACTWHFRMVSRSDNDATMECTLLNSRTETGGALFNTKDPVTCRLTNVYAVAVAEKTGSAAR